MIEKGVLHLDQREFMVMRKDRKKGKRKERGEEVKFSTGFPVFEHREFYSQETS